MGDCRAIFDLNDRRRSATRALLDWTPARNDSFGKRFAYKQNSRLACAVMFIECAPLFNSYSKRFEVIPADQPQVFLWSWRPSLRREKLVWRPHPKSMSLGQLAMHVASIPGNLSRLVQSDEVDASQPNFTPSTPGSVEEILTAHDEALRAAEDYIGGVDEQTALESWRLTFKGKEVFTPPRGGVIRSLMLNHWYYHRGQLSF